MAPASASANTIQTTVMIKPSAPLLGDPLGGVQTIVSNLVGATTQAVCKLTGIQTLCTLNVLSYGIATDYRRPDGTHVVKVTGGVINVPTFVDSTGDGLPDVAVTVNAISTSNIKLTIQKLVTAPSTFPVSVEALVNDPSTPNRLINVGYDARATSAPHTWQAWASLSTGTTTSVNATLNSYYNPSSEAVLGGLFTEGSDGARLNPKQARLTYTPVPDWSTINFSISNAVKTGTIGASTPTKADLELLMLDGFSGLHVLGTLDKLQKPVSLLLDKVDSAGHETDGTTGNTHVRLTTQKDVAHAGLTYETVTDAQVLQRIRLATGALPAQTDFTQTPDGFVTDTTDPVDVAGGVASGVPATGGSPAIPVPPAAPVESAEASYVHQDTASQIDSTTFRVAGVQHASVATDGTGDDRKITIGARLKSAPLHVLVTNDTAPGGTRYDADIKDLPHNLSVSIAPHQKRIVDFCGSSGDAADPCGATGQASPAGIGSITLNDSHSPTPMFGRATRINGKLTGIPSRLGVDVQTRAPSGPSDPDQNTQVYIDTTNAIGSTVLRATDGSAAPPDPSDNGFVYEDTPAQYAVVAKVDGFRRAHLDTSPKLALDLRADGGHTFSYLVDTADRHIDGSLINRPARTTVTLASGTPTVLDITGADSAGTPAVTPRLKLNLAQTAPLFAKATSLQADVSSIPSSEEVTIDSRGPSGPSDPDQDTKVHVDAVPAIPGTTIVRATDGSAPPADPTDDGVVYQDDPALPYAIIAKVDGFSSVHLDTQPKLDVTLAAASGHDFSYAIHLPPDGTNPAKDFDGKVSGRPAKTHFYFDNPDGGPLTVHLDGADASGDPVGTGGITLDALHLSGDPADNLHNVRVALQGVPASLDLVKQPSPAPPNDVLNIAVTTGGGSLGVADVVLDNDNLPDASAIPALPAGGGGAIVFSDGTHFFVHAHVLKLRSVSLVTKPNLDAALDVAQPQDFRVYLNTGMGADGTQNPNNCDGFSADQHNPPHVEYHDVFIKSLQPNTQFHYVTGNDGNSDPCKVKSWRTIEYSADGRADSITYDTDVGDMGHLHAVIGQEGSNPLQVPDHLKVCQASNDECFQQIHRFKQCTIAGVDYDYCTTSSADATVYVEAYHEKTHLALNFCAINQTVSDHDSCTRAGARQGIFVKLNTAHTDMGYHYDTGFGFLTINSEKHTDDGSADDGANQGVNGFVRVINHDSVAEYINLNFGYDPTQGSEWDAPSSTFDNSYGVITFAAPLVGTHDGDASCVNPAYGPSWSESDSYFHVILRTAGNSENDLGDNLTNLECGLF